MKKILFGIAIFSAAFASAQSPKPAEAVKGTQYGAGVSEAETFNVYSPEALAKKLETTPRVENVVIQAKTSGVCDKKGCWLTLANKENMTFFVKMKDYAFFLPQSILGKTVLLKGTAEKKTTSVEELKHYAEDAKKPKEEIAKITAPKTEVRILASGIKVID